ncbi:MAG TPA: hypothetical protein VLJ16_02420 [Acidobacteriota bacterium]|nr:hypothetical protein [Acidobacteriota bacterium]
MNAFWTAEEATFRRTLRAHFGAPDGGETPGPPDIPASLGLAGWAAVAEEAACRDPKLGALLTRDAREALSDGPAAAAVLACSRLAGAAAHVLAAGLGPARERGAFASSLLGCRDVQESLAGLVTGAELMRLGACRLCRLLDRGDIPRADAESVRILAGLRAFAAEVRAAAVSLLGADWAAANLAEDRTAAPDERTTP